MSCVVHCRLCFSDNYIPLTLLCVVPFSLTVKCRCVFSKRFIIFLVDFFCCGNIIFGVASWRRILCECCTSFRNCFAKKKIFIKVVGKLVMNM